MPPAAEVTDAAYRLARQYMPILMLDDNEPFRPVVVGYHVFTESGPSPSFPRTVQPEVSGNHGNADGERFDVRPARCKFVIEYAFWWDWDIQHLYELEHAWVYVGDTGRVEKVEASWHGQFRDMRVGEDDGAVLRGHRPVLYVKPGKHAFAPTPKHFEPLRDEIVAVCGRMAGAAGVWETQLYAGKLPPNTPLARRLVHTYLDAKKFVPSFVFNTEDTGETWHLVPWAALEAWIPARIAYWLELLKTDIAPHQRRWLRIAHRGASEEHVENGATALRKAGALGADMVEIDVRLTSDGVPVVFHDETLERVSTGVGPVREQSLAALRNLKLRDERTGMVTDDGIMTLDEVLALCREERLGVYVDIKDPDAVPAIAASLRAHQWQRFAIVGSGDIRVLERFRDACPEVPTSWLVGWPAPPIAEMLEALEQVSASYMHPCWENVSDRPDWLLSVEDVATVHAAGKGIICWHEERPDVIAGLRMLGVDGVCSNRPDMLV